MLLALYTLPALSFAAYQDIGLFIGTKQPTAYITSVQIGIVKKVVLTGVWLMICDVFSLNFFAVFISTI